MTNRKEEEKFEIAKSGKEIVLNEAVCDNCGARYDMAKDFCPRCGLKKGLPVQADVFIRPYQRGPLSRSTGLLALLAFLLGLLGPLILGIGWLLAIIIGINVVSSIRKKGGFARDLKLAIWGIALGFLWIIIATSVIILLSYQRINKTNIRNNEANAVDTLKQIALAERYIKVGHLIDKDKNGQSEYASLKELAELNQPYLKVKFPTSGQKNVYHGYTFSIYDMGESNFIAEAIPVNYRQTGRRTFYVSQDGLLKGGDISGHSIIDTDTILPNLSDKCLYDDFHEELARRLLNLAKNKGQEEKKFNEAIIILEEIKQTFPLAKSIEELPGLALKIAELEREEKARKALAELKDTKKDETAYLKALQTIKRDFPGTSIIPEIEDEINRVDLSIKRALEEEAAGLYKKCLELELAGKLDEAKGMAKKIVDEYGICLTAEKAREKLNVLTQEIMEKEAEEYLKKIVNLTPEKDFLEILRIIAILKKDYASTKAIANKDWLNDLSQKITFYKLKEEGLVFCQSARYKEAILSLEEAKKLFPARDEVIDTNLIHALTNQADLDYKKGLWLEAKSNYEKALSLEAKKVDEVSRGQYAQCVVKLAEASYYEHKFDEAEKYLQEILERFYCPSPYNYLYGSIYLKKGEHQKAVDFFKTELSKSPDTELKSKILTKYILGYLSLYIEKEKEVLKILQGEQAFSNRGVEVARDSSVLTGKILRAEAVAKVKAADKIDSLNTFRQDYEAIKQKVIHNNSHIKKVQDQFQTINEFVNIINANLDGFSSRNKSYIFRQIEAAWRRKCNIFRNGMDKLNSGTSCLRIVQDECLSITGSAIDCFSASKTVSKNIQEIKDLYEGMALQKVAQDIADGLALIDKAVEITLPLQQAISSID